MLATLPDVQSLEDKHHIDIDRVGVRGLTFPMTIQSVDGAQPTVAEADLYVFLSREHRGTHMSRFVSLLSEAKAPLSRAMMCELLEQMLDMLESTEGTIEIRCPFFVNKSSPVSGLKSLMNYKVRFVADCTREVKRVIQEVEVPVTSLCPCSREISAYGAHNQRSRINLALELNSDMSLEEQIRIAETSASCELWSRLKRNDEKFVTEFAYDHPKFVEDAARDVAEKLNEDARVLAYDIKVENFESIHNHSAYASIVCDKRHA